MEELIMAILDRIKIKLDGCYWNKNQREMNSPFENTGASYSNDFFTVRAYNWNEEDDQKPNFESELLTCWWYKHSHRGLSYRLDFDPASKDDHLEQLNSFLNECLNSIERDFVKKKR